jgi:hypothetical protein
MHRVRQVLHRFRGGNSTPIARPYWHVACSQQHRFLADHAHAMLTAHSSSPWPAAITNYCRSQVWVSQDELERIAKHLNMSTNKFINAFCKSYGRAEGWRMLKNHIDDDVRRGPPIFHPPSQIDTHATCGRMPRGQQQ